MKLNLILVLERGEFSREVTPLKSVLGEETERKLTLRIKNYLEEEKNRQSVVKKSL